MTNNRGGFTLVEMLVAIIVLSFGLLGLAGTTALVTRMIGRGQRSGAAAAFAAQRMERLRIAACIPAQRVSGTENLMRGGAAAATNTWSFTSPGSGIYRILLVTKATTVQNHTRTDTLEMAVTCSP